MLWKHPDFLKLWLGQAVSEFGSHISRDAIPVVAVITLAASPAQMGLLVTAASVPVLVLGLFAGAWVDRLRRRPIMIFTDLARLLLLLSIPLMALTDTLSMTVLYAVTALISTFSLFFNLAYRSILPSLISRTAIPEGNSKLATTDSLAEIGGPAVTGLLIQAVTAPFAILFDAATFLVSAVTVSLIRTPEPAPEHPDENLLAEMMEGISVITHHPVLWILAVGIGWQRFFGNFFATLYSLYVIRELGLSPSELGFLIGCGGIGALMGAALSRPLLQRFGMGTAMTGALLLGASINLLIPMAGGSPLMIFLMMAAAQIIGDAAMTVFQIHDMSLRQILVPDRLLGRANASMDFLAEGVSPMGALAAGVMATFIGTRLTIWVAVLGILASALWILFSPVRRLSSLTIEFVGAE